MSEQNGILYAAEVRGDGHGALLTSDEATHSIAADTLAWVHLDGRHPEARHWIETEISYLDPLIIEALLAEETRPRIVEFDQGALLILRGVNLNADADPEDMVSVRLWVDRSRIVSVQLRSLKAVRDIQDRLANGTGPRNSGEFVAALTGRLFERMEPVMTALGEQMDDLEEAVMDNPSVNERQAINGLRKRAIILRRYLAPQRDVIGYLRSTEFAWLETPARRRLQENLDRITRYLEDLDAIRERGQIIKDELASGLADRMNRNLYVLSVIAALFLPLGFLTGLLGINVGGIPGTDSGMAFTIVVALMAGIGVGQALLFRWLKWI